MRVLIANRGEIARRVIRTARQLGYSTVAVYADPDFNAPFVSEADVAVRLGPAPLTESYLSIDRILESAVGSNVDAIHPGYGFLSENADFARSVTQAGMIWVGPHQEAIEAMGSKIEARRLASTANVPVIPGFDESQDDHDLADAANSIGYPVLVKAAAGGGGKGIRIANKPTDFATALSEARSEAERSFGDSDVIVERYIVRPRHIEVQVIGDKHGSVINLGTRECSVQRRYQKVLEEAPAPNLPEITRAGLSKAAVELAESIGYDSTGTVEFIVDDAAIDTDPGAYFFLEMNTRLQVEHPVTEAITGLDLVELQLKSAIGNPLPIRQSDVDFNGHAFEARINAEDAGNAFAPQIGKVWAISTPDNARWDSGISVGSEITPHYDPMVAKLIVHGTDRETSRNLLAGALEDLLIGGLVTNAGFHRWLIDQDPVREGRVTTRFLDETTVIPVHAAATAAEVAAREWLSSSKTPSGTSMWKQLHSFRLTPHITSHLLSLKDLFGVTHDVELTANLANTSTSVPTIIDRPTRQIVVNVAGQPHTFQVISRSERWAPDIDSGHGSASSIVAPFPAVVTEIKVTPGEQVSAGDIIVVVEAMKMLHTLTAAGPGEVNEVRVAIGEQIASNQVLVTFAAPDDVGGK